MNIFIYGGIALVVLFCLYAGAFIGYREFIIEKPIYRLVEKKQGYEIRQYDAYIVASYTREQGGINSGFMQVAGYIFGDNQGSSTIAMTSPVIDAPQGLAIEPVTQGQKISMTSPVIDAPQGDGRSTSFVLPREYTLADLPTPNNPDLVLQEIPVTQWAVLRFSAGPYQQERLEKRKNQLLQYLERDGVVHTGEYQFAFYDPPGLVWPLRRDEVWVKLQ